VAHLVEVAGSFSSAVIRTFYCPNPPGCIMALGLTQSITEMSNKNISCGVKSADA